MNPTLAAMYNTNGFAAVAHREQVKVAHLELFAKAAAAQGIDLTSLDQGTANALYAEFTQKLAEEGAEVPADESPAHEEGESTDEEKEEQEKGDDEDKGESSEGESSEGSEEEKKEAQAQFRTMQEWQQKVAEADYLGRVMAHAFHNEDAQIKQASGEIVRHAGDALATVGKKKGLSTAAKAGLAAGGAYAAHRAMKKKDEGSKEASAFDVQAARHALKIASQAKLNTKEAAARLNALLTLGVPEMNKTASALGNYDQALNVRALELLEAGGYPINWDQVFGG